MVAANRLNRIATFIQGTRAHLPLLRDIADTSSARIYSTLLSLATLMLTARWLGPEGRGIVVVITTWTALAGGIVHLSIGQVLVHRAATTEGNDWIGPALGAVAAVTAVVTAIGWMAVALLFSLFGGRLFDGIPSIALALGMGALPFLVWEQYGSAMLSIIGRLKTYNLAQIVGRTLGLLMLVVTIKLLDLGIYGFLAAFVTAQMIIAGAGATALVRHANEHIKGGLNVARELIRDGLKLHLNAIGVLLFSGIDILMLQYFLGPAAAGVFQLPMQLFLAMLLVPQAAQLALQSRVASLSRAEFWREHRLVMAIVIGGMILVAAVLWLLARWVVMLVGGDEFTASVPIFRILLIGVPWACFNTLMALQWITRGYFFQASLVTIATGATNVLLNLFFIPAFGPVGAAYAALIGMCAVPLVANAWLASSAQREFTRSRGGA